MALRGEPHPNLPTPPSRLRQRCDPKGAPRAAGAPAAPAAAGGGRSCGGSVAADLLRSRAAPGDGDRGRGKAGVGAAGRARRFVLGFAMASAARGERRRPAALPRVPGRVGTRQERLVRGRARGGGARPHLGPDLVAALTGLDVHDLPHARCVAGGCGTRADCRAGCGGFAAPATRSYRLGPARHALRGVTARGQSGELPQNAAPVLQHPSAATGVWGPPVHQKGGAGGLQGRQ